MGILFDQDLDLPDAAVDFEMEYPGDEWFPLLEAKRLPDGRMAIRKRKWPSGSPEPFGVLGRGRKMKIRLVLWNR